MPKIKMSKLNIATIAQQAQKDAAAALSEDIGSGDLSASLAPANSQQRGILICRDNAVLCGQPWFEACFLHLDKNAAFIWQVAEGGDLSPQMTVCEVQAETRALLTAERSALNFLQTLSATATAARRYQKLAGGTKVTDTRKTLPKLRVAQKYAVRTGGAYNHRMGLYDEILIKENHIMAAGGIAAVLAAAHNMLPESRVQIEVRTINDLRTALAAGARRVLLDNFSLADIQAAVQIAQGRAELESSGGVEENNIAALAATGVDRISIGALTKNIRAVDFSLVLADFNMPCR